LLIFSALAFAWLMRNGIYPPELRSVNLDFDWFYRRLGFRAVSHAAALTSSMLSRGSVWRSKLADQVSNAARHAHGPGSPLARTWSTGSSALWMMIALLALLLGGYFA
jgi:multicomponent Na+:H+ antiporter subunit D